MNGDGADGCLVMAHIWTYDLSIKILEKKLFTNTRIRIDTHARTPDATIDEWLLAGQEQAGKKVHKT